MTSDRRDDAAPEGDGDPTRLCVGCRRTDERDALLRFVVEDADAAALRLVADPLRKLPGRGVSVHPTRACLEAAVRRGGFARALKRSVSLDLEAIVAGARERYLARVAGLLLAAGRTRSLAIGTDAVREALWRGNVHALVIAKDAEGRREELEALASKLERHVAVIGDKEWLGRLLGRAEVGVIGVLEPGIADQIVRSAARATELSEAE